jgi:predicted nucleotidyltransferase
MLEVTESVTMAWPSKTIGNLYSSLYSKHQTNSFHVSSVTDLVKSSLRAKVYLFRLKKLGWVYKFEPAGPGYYRLQKPESCFLISSGDLRNISALRDPAYSGLIASYVSEARRFEGIESLVLFGSVARGEAKTTSDIDLLGVFNEKKNIDVALGKTAQSELRGELSRELDYLETFEIHTGISILPMTRKQFLSHPFVLLDVFADGVPFLDKGLFERESDKVKTHLKKISARRTYLSRHDWYWDLNPTSRGKVEISI